MRSGSVEVEHETGKGARITAEACDNDEVATAAVLGEPAK